jgi:hypothetical protein
MNLFSSPPNESPGPGRKFVPGLGWIDLSGGLDKYLQDPFDEQPRTDCSPEFGWDEVHRGLGQIVIGQVIWGACGLLTVLLGWLLSPAVGPTHPFHVPSDFKDEFRLIGLVIIGMITAVGYRFSIAGKWRCLLNAPERNGLRWIMFACITGIVTAPIFHTTAYLTSGPAHGDLQEHDVVYLKKVKLNSTQAALDLAGAGSVLISSVALMAFFRKTAHLFSSPKLMHVIDFALFALIPLLGVTLAVFFHPQVVAKHPVVLTGMEFGWLSWALLHLLLNLRTRSCIERQTQPQPHIVPSTVPS